MNEDQGRVFVQWLVPASVVVVIIMIMFFNFSNKTKLEAIEVYENEITAIADRYAVKINNDLQIMLAAGSTAAQFMDANVNMSDQLRIKLLSALTDNTESYMAVYYEPDERGIRQDGSVIDLNSCSYNKTVSAIEDSEFINLGKDEITGKEAILLTVPTRNDGKILMYYSLERIKALTKINTEFDSDAFTALINVDGTIIQACGSNSYFLENGNLWNNLAPEYKNAITKAKVRIQNANLGCVTAAAGGEARTLVYAPVRINEWAFVVGINQAYVDEQEMQLWRETSKMLYQIIGVIAVFLCVVIAINIVSKVRSAEKNKALQEKADTDLLTGLHNKLATERKIKDYIEQFPESPGLMFVLDIDNFKKINDTMGHAFGDEVLRCLGKEISCIFRVTDVVGRTGGDEFTIFLKNIKNESNCTREAQKLVTFFKGFVAGEYVKYAATASIGAAIFPKDGKDFETLYKAADQALYKAKKRGKNQLAFYNDANGLYKPEDVKTDADAAQ